MTDEELRAAMQTAHDIRMRYPSSIFRIRCAHIPAMFYVRRAPRMAWRLVTLSQAKGYARACRAMGRAARRERKRNAADKT